MHVRSSSLRDKPNKYDWMCLNRRFTVSTHNTQIHPHPQLNAFFVTPLQCPPPPSSGCSSPVEVHTTVESMQRATPKTNSRAVVPSAQARQVAVRSRVVPASSFSSSSRAVRPRAYGDIVDSDEVHPEIEALGREAKRVIQENLQPTTEAQVLEGVKRFGPSKASKKILNRENEAATMAHETGIYVVWRCMETPALSGANNDFCARLGYAHRCFCQHPMSQHARPSLSARGTNARAMRCQVEGCVCPCFRYIPNTPEEIGEGWLSRRANWDPKLWSPKCRCSHGSKAHDSALRTPCRLCACAGFESHCLCVVCDKPMEAHQTVVETEAERRAAGLPVGATFFPLAGIDWEVREMVLADPTGRGALQAPPSCPVITPPRGTRGAIASRATHASTKAAATTDMPLVMDSVPFCGACGTVFTSSQSKFCRKCGQPRTV